jgi:hypothetical protein
MDQRGTSTAYLNSWGMDQRARNQHSLPKQLKQGAERDQHSLPKQLGHGAVRGQHSLPKQLRHGAERSQHVSCGEHEMKLLLANPVVQRAHDGVEPIKKEIDYKFLCKVCKLLTFTCQ